MSNKVDKLVTAAVIKAMAESGNDIIAERTAELLSEPAYGSGYGIFHDYWVGGRTDKSETRLDRMVREEIVSLSRDAVAEWIEGHSDEIKASVVARLSPEAIAETYVSDLLRVASEGRSEIEVHISRPTDA